MVAPEVEERAPRIALRGITGHVARSTAETMAWYRLAPRAWSMQPDDDRERLMAALGLALAQLSGRWLHWRVTWSPFDAAEWARRHDGWARPLPDQPDGVGWADHLVGEQRRALRAPKAVKRVYLGVELRHGSRRRALVSTAGNVESAIDELRKAGLKSAEKKSQNEMGEGRLTAFVGPKGRVGSMVAMPWSRR